MAPAPSPAAPAATVVCRLDQIPRGGGVAALVDGRQVAVFRTDDDGVHALDNRDPFTRANVLSRGIVGVHGGVPTVASPLRKQRFDLTSGRCLDDPAVSVAVHTVHVSTAGEVAVSVADDVAHVADDVRDTQP